MANPVKEIDERVRGYFGSFPVPDISRILPPPPSPRQTELALMGASADIADFLLGMIPTVGDVLADIVVDNIEADMRRRFSEAERAEFAEQTRFLPSGIAAFKAVARVELRRLGGK